MGKYFQKETDRVFDMKWLFNVSQFIILASIAYRISGILTVEPTVRFIMSLIGLVLIYDMMNFLMTGLVVTLYSGRNRFNEFRLKTILKYMFFYSIIVTMLIFSYEAYDVSGTLFIAALIIPIQSAILQSIATYELNEKLISDKLTSAFNRYFLEETVMENLELRKPFTLLFMDLDGFKQINDRYGHVVGDGILIDFVNQLQGHLRREDRVFRYGGDEFCILFNDRESAEGLKKRLLQDGNACRCEISGQSVDYSYSMGFI
jgi:diguanylate cyclase (GGDEF)-like protein